ncbi:MAG: 4Fe-4S dicluster domain-containing protein [Acidobacteriota bacterium]
MATRKIIEIDRELCDGCGLCTTACAEGALELDEENKAVLVNEIYCDGMGACLDVCPTGALRITERESDDYDAQAVYTHVLKSRGAEAAAHIHGVAGHGNDRNPAKAEISRLSFPSGCPGARACEISPEPENEDSKQISAASELRQWPIQLHLVSPFAPYFRESDLLIAADCTAFALGSFHSDLLKEKKLIIGCPKLDETEGYIEKLADIIRQNNLRSLTVAIMTVPCCSGLFHIVQKAVDLSGTQIDLKKKVIHVDGQLIE